jgi:hypothetical protein
MKEIHRTIRHTVALFCVGFISVSLAAAQDDSGAGNAGAAPAATAPAEQNNIENPPLSGLDAPTAEPAFGGRSYVVSGLQLSESVDSNAASTSSNNTHPSEITRAVGSVDLQKIWRRYQLGLDYIAGGDFYAGPRIAAFGSRATQVHTFSAVQRILWRTGQLAIRDSFDYLPEGSFGFSSYGGAAGFGSAVGGGISGAGAGTGIGGGLAGGTPGGLGATYGSIGYQPRVNNSAIVDVVQGLSPRSTVTFAGGYNFTDYLDKSSAPFPIINSQQTTGQVGYNHILSRKDQVGIEYLFQELHFPTAGSGSVIAHVWNGLYGHRISGKLNFTVAGGPQLVIVHNPPLLILGATIPVPETKTLSSNGSVTLGYTVSTRANLQMMYQRYVSPGSGFYAGANTDAARVSLGYRLGRHWSTTTDLGYSHNSNLQKSSNTSAAGVHSSSYQFWYAGTSLQRQLGEHFGAFVSYQFNDTGIGQCTSSSSSVCGFAARRHTGMVGINWHSRPIRLD